MQCTNCGTQFPDDSFACPNCGTPVNGNYQQNYQQPYQQLLSKKDFFKHPNLKSCRSNITAAAVILYVCAVITLIFGFMIGNYLIVLDVLIIIGLGLGIQLAKSRVCAILICVYAGLNALVSIVSNGTVGGTLIIIAAVYAVIATFKFQTAWSNYQKTGILPAPK